MKHRIMLLDRRMFRHQKTRTVSRNSKMTKITNDNGEEECIVIATYVRYNEKSDR